jgi:hypothetical protein
MNNKGDSCGRTLLEARDGVAVGVNSGARKTGGEMAGAAGDVSEREIVGREAADLAGIPEGVRASAATKAGEYDARRLRSQREIIRDVMVSAADCETWLTLGELRALTRYGETSISAQLRHLRKAEYGGYDVVKRHRDGGRLGGRTGADGRGEVVWEYRITPGMRAECAGSEAELAAVGG